MNSAISNLRPHCSQIVKLILFFYSGGARFLLFLFSLSFSFPSFFPVSHSCSEPPTISLLFLSLLDVSASLFDETQAGALSQADLYRSGFFFCYLMVDLAVVVWVMDLVFQIGVQWCCVGCGLRFQVGFGSLIDQLGWGFRPLFFFFLFFFYIKKIVRGFWQWWL